MTVRGGDAAFRVPAVSGRRRATGRLDRGLLQAATLPLGQSAPDAEALVVGEGVLEALGADLAREADLLGLPGRSALLGEEGLGVGLGAQRALLPAELLVRVVDRRLLHPLGDGRPSAVFHVPVMQPLPIPAERHACDCPCAAPGESSRALLLGPLFTLRNQGQAESVQ